MDNFLYELEDNANREDIDEDLEFQEADLKIDFLQELED